MSPGHETSPELLTEMRPALALALELEHAQMGVLLLHDEASGALVPALGEGLSDDAFARLGAHPTGPGPFDLAFTERRRVNFADARQSGNGLAELARLIGFRGIDIVPIGSDGAPPVGALAMMFRRARAPSDRSVHLVELCTRLVAYVLENARLRKVAEDEQHRAEHLGQARLQFLARMSHELRAPLQSIAGYVELLRLGVPDLPSEAQRVTLDRVRRSEEVLTRVIDDLIAFAQLEAGRIQYHVDAVVAAQMLSSAEIVVAPLARARDVTLVTDPCAIDLTVAADPAKLLQVLINLLSNALKFTPTGGTVRLSCDEVPTGHVVFRVSDTGPGISKDKIASIFEPYVQLDTPVETVTGSGLGLAISREFAAGMHGELTVESTPGAGSTFALTLPRHVPPA